MSIAARLVAALLQESLISGEYWITADGDALYADMDYSHEGIAQEYARRQVLSGLEADTDIEWVDESHFNQELRRVFSDADPATLPAKVTHEVQALGNPDALKYVTAAFANPDRFDFRDWAITNLGWIWVRQDNFTAYELNRDTLRVLRQGADNILNQEGLDEELPHTEIRLASLKDGKNYTITASDLINGEFNLGQTSYALDQPAPRASVRTMDTDLQPPFYGKHLGDAIGH